VVMLCVRLVRRFAGVPRKNLRTLWTWGNADFGRSGSDDNSSASAYHKQHLEPIEIKVLPQNLIQQVVCGGAHTLLVSASGRLLSCGLGSQGQLGSGFYESDGEFLPVENLDTVKHAAAGFWHSAVALKSGEVFTWGSNKNNQVRTCMVFLIGFCD
jgi:alpha-tubulin suppressor-like RCC1 family protein